MVVNNMELNQQGYPTEQSMGVMNYWMELTGKHDRVCRRCWNYGMEHIGRGENGGERMECKKCGTMHTFYDHKGNYIMPSAEGKNK